MTLTQLQEQRHKLALDVRKIIDAAKESEQRLSAEETTKVNTIFADIDKLDDEIRAVKRYDEMENHIQIEPRKVDDTVEQNQPENRGAYTLPARKGDEYRSAFMSYLRHGKNGLQANEVRALEVGTANEGGNVVYEEFERRIIEFLDEENVMRQLGTVITTGGDRNIPVETAHDSAAYLGEEAAYAEDLTGGASKHTFGQVTLGAFKLAYIIKVSEELLRDTSDIDFEGYLARTIARKFGAAEEEKFINGTGTTMPTGIMAGGAAGKTLAAYNAITGDEVIDIFHALKRPYRRAATWVMSDGTIKSLRKLKTTTGTNEYLWQPGLQAGEPDRLLGRPVFASSAANDLGTVDTNVIAFGDMSYFWIADRGARVIQRLNELYAANGQIGFRAYERHDSNVLVDEAIQVAKTAAST
jgi:HK97 family phage major capsid protein